MITDEDYADLKKQMFKEFKENIEWQGTIGDVSKWWILGERTNLSRKLANYLNEKEVHEALNKVTVEYCTIKFASLDLAEALQYAVNRPKDWSPEKARDLGRAALAKAGISIPEPMNQEEYAYYVASIGAGETIGYIESGWEYFQDACDQMDELQDAGVRTSVYAKCDLIVDPWDNNNWRNAL